MNLLEQDPELAIEAWRDMEFAQQLVILKCKWDDFLLWAKEVQDIYGKARHAYNLLTVPEGKKAILFEKQFFWKTLVKEKFIEKLKLHPKKNYNRFSMFMSLMSKADKALMFSARQKKHEERQKSYLSQKERFQNGWEGMGVIFAERAVKTPRQKKNILTFLPKPYIPEFYYSDSELRFQIWLYDLHPDTYY